jgi:hypothetical protein
MSQVTQLLGAIDAGDSQAATPAAPGYASISWTPAIPGYVLQETWDLSSASWTYSVSGSTNPITLPTDASAKFFRLQKQ